MRNQDHILRGAKLFQTVGEIVGSALHTPRPRHFIATAKPGAIVSDDLASRLLRQLGNQSIPIGRIQSAAGIENNDRQRALLNVEGDFVAGARNHLRGSNGLTIVSVR